MIDNTKLLAYYMDNDDFMHTLTAESHPCAFWKRTGSRTQVAYSIDGHEVPKSTYDKACELMKGNKSENTIRIEKDVVNNMKNMTALGDIVKKYAALNDTAYNDFAEKKEEKDMNNRNWIHTMPSIKSHKYIKDHGVTIIEFNDGTVTKVVCDPMIADEFTGFCAAIAKRAMGNGGKMLAEWERLVIKPEEDKKKTEEKKRIEAEQKAEEERRRAEAKVKRAEKKARRNAKREELERQKAIEEIAEIFARDYAETDLYEEAARLAIEKYGVPKEFFADKHDCCCKEFDVMDEDEDNISD